jgi:hypothetical protein
MENINYFKVSVKEVQRAFPKLNFAQARVVQRSCIEFSILEHHARHTSDEEFLSKVNESVGTILELNPFNGDQRVDNLDMKNADPNDPDVKKYNDYMAAHKAAKGGKGQSDTMGPKMDFSSGEEAPEPEKKKGFFGQLGDKAKAVMGVKKYIAKAAEFIKQAATSKEGKRAIAIAAAMVVISVLPGASVLLPVAKGLLGLYSVFKGSSGIMNQGKELSGGKSGIAGVKEFFKNVSNVPEAAKAVANLASIGLGAWGASSAIGNVLTQIKTTAAEHIFNKDGAPAIAHQPAPHAATPHVDVKPDAPVAPAHAPEAPAAAAVAHTDPSKMIHTMQDLVRQNYDEYLQRPEHFNEKIFAYLTKSGVDLNSPAAEVFKGVRGNLNVKDYIEMTLEGIAKAKQMSGG